MSHTAWPTITDVADLAASMNVTFGTAISTAVQQGAIDSVVENVGRRTHRTFIPVTEQRYYDGNDTGELEIDDFVTLYTVQLVGWYGVVSGITMDNLAQVDRATFPTNRLQIYRGSLPSFYRYWIDRFPRGRGNVAVSATWAYANTIPDDLWWGVAYQAAGILINRRNYTTAGYLVKWTEDETTEVRNYMDPFKFFKSGTTYEGLLKQYRKPSGYFIRKQQRQLV